jgi:hypothetical protein
MVICQVKLRRPGSEGKWAGHLQTLEICLGIYIYTHILPVPSFITFYPYYMPIPPDHLPTIDRHRRLSAERRPMGWNIGPTSVDVGGLPTDDWQTSADNIPMLGRSFTSSPRQTVLGLSAELGRSSKSWVPNQPHRHTNVSRWWFDNNMQNTPRCRPINPVGRWMWPRH